MQISFDITLKPDKICTSTTEIDMTNELLNKIADMAVTFNYDYQQMGYNAWLSWDRVKVEAYGLCKNLTREEKKMIFDRVGELHNICVEPYLQYGISKIWDESTEKQDNVRHFIGFYKE
jgi:hypothetical protein